MFISFLIRCSLIDGVLGSFSCMLYARSGTLERIHSTNCRCDQLCSMSQAATLESFRLFTAFLTCGCLWGLVHPETSPSYTVTQSLSNTPRAERGIALLEKVCGSHTAKQHSTEPATCKSRFYDVLLKKPTSVNAKATRSAAECPSSELAGPLETTPWRNRPRQVAPGRTPPR